MSEVRLVADQAIVKRSIVIPRKCQDGVVRGHKTSVSMERLFWDGFKEIGAERAATLGAMAAELEGSNDYPVNLSSSIRLYVYAWERKKRLALHGAAIERLREVRASPAPAAQFTENH